MTIAMEKATFSAGCFWGVQAAFDKLSGVIYSEAGFMGGDVKDPTYHQVNTLDTGHAEVVQVIYDPEKINYEDLLSEFWEVHNPTLLNQQGADMGSQYRSVIFYNSEKQKKLAEHSKLEEQMSGKYDMKIATTIEPACTFYPAEEKHQKYLEKQNLGQSK